MGIGTSIFLIALGAILKYAVTASVSGISLQTVGVILKYAVTASVSGVSLQTVGVILMVAGVLGLIISFIWMAMARNREPRGGVVRDREVY